MTATTRSFDPTALDDTLCLALELGEGRWKLGFARGFGGKVLRRQVVARDGQGLLAAIEWAKGKLALSSVRVVSLYEAGRDGFWLHRFLVAHGIENLVIDSSSLEVDRRRRRAKTDRLDLEGSWTCSGDISPAARRRCSAWCGCRRWRRRIGAICTGSCKVPSAIARA